MDQLTGLHGNATSVLCSSKNASESSCWDDWLPGPTHQHAYGMLPQRFILKSGIYDCSAAFSNPPTPAVVLRP